MRLLDATYRRRQYVAWQKPTSSANSRWVPGRRTRPRRLRDRGVHRREVHHVGHAVLLEPGRAPRESSNVMSDMPQRNNGAVLELPLRPCHSHSSMSNVEWWGACLAAALVVWPGSAEAAPGDAATQRALLDKYCVTCHNDRVKTANL